MFVGCLDDSFVSYTSSWLSYVLHSALCSPVDIVSEREECVGSEGYSFVFLKPSHLFFFCKLCYRGEEIIIPIRNNVYLRILRQELLYDVVFVITSNAISEWKRENIWVLSKPPLVSLLPGKPCAVYS